MGFAVSLWDTKEHADASVEGTRSVVEAFAVEDSKEKQTLDVVEGPLPIL